ncbi:hypothetical protein J8655_16975 [Dickeya oryzae]|uniref:hypothetical protein n=1 Tax=Dickeya oryzae TaxID=1240404 RepID=UPI001AECE4BA|nr:hypothetical protein [Dickeya oryzae]
MGWPVLGGYFSLGIALNATRDGPMAYPHQYTIFTGMTSLNQVWHAILGNIEVLLLRILIIRGIYSNKRLLTPRLSLKTV